MVTEAGKELLRNTINTAKFHNRIIEENEMWKQWELECGLTMMVSDDDILKKIRKNHMCSKHRRSDKSNERDRSDELLLPSAGTSKADSARWDHSGFQELYPNGVASLPSTSKSNSAKWDHGGFHELYPGKAKAEKDSSSSSSKSHSNKEKKKKKKKRRRTSKTDNEIWEDFKRYKRSKTDKRKLKPEHEESSSSGFDNHVKEWKKMKHKS